MPLDPSGLESDLLSLFQAPPIVMVGDEVDFTASRSACAQAWADAMQAYALAVVPVSTGVVAAAAALSASLASAFALGAAGATVDAAFQTFAAAVGAGMAPSWIATPPPAPPGFAANLATPQPTHTAAASFWAGLIDAWMRTGTATFSGGGSPVPWL